MRPAGDVWRNEATRGKTSTKPNWYLRSLPPGCLGPRKLPSPSSVGVPRPFQPTPPFLGPIRTHWRWGTETCNAKLDLLRVTDRPGAATAVGASILCPQGADDQGAIRLQPVPE